MVLILASASPRRRELLRNAGILFEVQAAGIDETVHPQEKASDYVSRLAREKAFHVARTATKGNVVLALDTTIELDGAILGKPSDKDDAAGILRRLSGRTHRVLTGVCLVSPPEKIEALEVAATSVSFCHLTDSEIQAYVASGEPFDKAGAYAIQGLASKFVTKVEGCPFNVGGMPVALVYPLLNSVHEERQTGGKHLTSPGA
ncbi:MAG: Maf family protein [Thermoplasmata archaeon]